MTNPKNFDRRTALALLAGSVTTVGFPQFDSALAKDVEKAVDQTAVLPDDRRLG